MKAYAQYLPEKQILVLQMFVCTSKHYRIKYKHIMDVIFEIQVMWLLWILALQVYLETTNHPVVKI